VAFLSCARSALAEAPPRGRAHGPENEITVGPLGGWVFGTGRERPLLLGAEFSYLPGNQLWVSVGGRALWSEPDTTGVLHAEAGIWLFATLGVGYSRRLWGDAFDPDSAHLFVGAPVPFAEAFDAGMFFAEPYYRPMLGLHSADVTHELGLKLKFTSYE
jgi:hypothetical protein